VTKRTLCFGRYSARALYSADISVMAASVEVAEREALEAPSGLSIFDHGIARRRRAERAALPAHGFPEARPLARADEVRPACAPDRLAPLATLAGGRPA
jgi:hypothetical protein